MEDTTKDQSQKGIASEAGIKYNERRKDATPHYFRRAGF
jgi:hypothetical protein